MQLDTDRRYWAPSHFYQIMVRLSIQEIHQLELGLIDTIARYCSSSGLTYYLAYGTLLGALRHGGFIPWDDDADLWMPREDFDQFVSSFRDSEEYYLVKPFSAGYAFGWAKIVDRRTSYAHERILLPEAYGLSIDIFPLDIDPGRTIAKKIRRQNMLRGYAMHELRKDRSFTAKEVMKTLVSGGAKLLPGRLYNERAFQEALAHGHGCEDRIINLFSRYGYDRENHEQAWFGEGASIVFEGAHTFRIPQNPEAVLENLYGKDWRTPVKYGHPIELYWREDSGSAGCSSE